MNICQIKSVSYHSVAMCTYGNILLYFSLSFTSHSSAVSQMMLSELMEVDNMYNSIALHRTWYEKTEY